MKLGASLLAASLLITLVTVYATLVAKPTKVSNPSASSPCYDRAQDINQATNGCPTITKTQSTDVYFKDFHVANLTQGPGTGACGQNTTGSPCPTCGMYSIVTKECWPKFLTPCSGNYQDGFGNWVGTWGRSVVSQSATQTNPICCGFTKPVTTCADTASDWYSVEHTCL